MKRESHGGRETMALPPSQDSITFAAKFARRSETCKDAQDARLLIIKTTSNGGIASRKSFRLLISVPGRSPPTQENFSQKAHRPRNSDESLLLGTPEEDAGEGGGGREEGRRLEKKALEE